MSEAGERVERRGRKTKAEEAWDFLAELGITPEAVERLKATGEPATFAEMLDLAAADLWADYKSLRGTAKVQAFKAIHALAKQEGGDGGGAKDEPLVADVIDGIASLSAPRRREILERALARLDEERAAIVAALA